MSVLTFSNEEKEFILTAIVNRRANCQGEFCKKHLVKLDKIQSELTSNPANLNTDQKATLAGCLREKYINPNKDFLKLSEFQMMFSTDEALSKMEDLDIVMNLLNKLRPKSEQKYRLFSDSLNKINGILNANQIFYSSTTNGEVYKASILIDGEKGIAFELDRQFEPCNFEVGKINPKHYMTEGTPFEVSNLLKNNSFDHELTVIQRSFNEILERVTKNPL